jgi:hypothetical protein
MTSLSDFVPEPWIQTYTGHQFHPLDPHPDEVDIRDIAHSLSQTCRYSGHCERFYSVAEHSVLVSRLVPTLEALLHDAGEAYSPFGDIPRPIKHHVPWAKPIDDAIDAAIAEHFGLRWPWPEDVKVADCIILADEKAKLMKPGLPWNLPYPAAGVRIECWSPLKAELEFLKRFRELEG